MSGIAMHGASRRRASGVLGVVGLLLAGITACSGPNSDQPEGSGIRVAASGTDEAKDTSADVGAATTSARPEGVDVTASAPAEPSVPADEAESSVPADDAESSVPADARPTLQEQPAPALPPDEIQETYGDNPEPAESVVGTLCNLTQVHLTQLSAATRSNGSVDDQMLRLAALSLSDDLSVWEGLAWQYPDLAVDIDTARAIYARWEYAIGLQDTGDEEAALKELQEVDQLIETLPDSDITEVGC